MAPPQLRFSVPQLARIFFLVGIVITIINYVYDHVFMVTDLQAMRQNRSLSEVVLIDDTQSVQQNNSNVQDAIICPTIPALIILGPTKAGTTSLIVSLAKYFPNWYDQNPVRENGHWYSELRLRVMRNESRLNALFTIIDQQRQSSALKISEYPFDSLFSDDIWPQSDILEKKYQFVHELLTRFTGDRIRNDTIILEKTAFNFYLFHLLQAFGKYFSSTQFGTYSVDDYHFRHHKGSKLISILRDPVKRVISFHSMKQRFKAGNSWNSLDYYVLNLSAYNSDVTEFRQLIMDRKDEYDDTHIMLKYIRWFYSVGAYRNAIETWKRPLPNVWLSEYMLMLGVEYPVLLYWIYGYQYLGLADYFKVVEFDYMVSHFKQVMHWIRCWVQDDVLDIHECEQIVKQKYRLDMNEEVEIEQTNQYSNKAKRHSDEVVVYMQDFYKPIMDQQLALIQRTNAMLGGELMLAQ